MASNAKKKTTMAKLNREQKMRERRLDKQARKDAKKEHQAAVARGEIQPEPEVVANHMQVFEEQSSV